MTKRTITKRELHRRIKINNKEFERFNKVIEKHKCYSEFLEKRGCNNPYTAYLSPLWKVKNKKDRIELQKCIDQEMRSAMLFAREDAKLETAKKLLRGLKRLHFNKDYLFISKLLGCSLINAKRWTEGVIKAKYKKWWIAQYKKASK